MSTQSPLPLYELVKHSLLKSETLAIIPLDGLPSLIFHEMFMEALMCGHDEVLKVMVQAWPFPCLPLGSLMEMRKPGNPQSELENLQLEERNLQTLKAVLHGLDMLLAQKVHPSRQKLQILDLRNVHQDFWTLGPRAMAHAWVPDNKCGEQTVSDCQVNRKKQLLKVTAELLTMNVSGNLNGFQAYLFEWAQQRRHLVHLCCRKLETYEMPFDTFMDVLKMLELNCVQEVEVCDFWSVKNLASFAPYLGQMRSLKKLALFSFTNGYCSPSSNILEYVDEFSLYLRELNCLQELYLGCAYFLKGCLDQVLRYLKIPLKTLSITHWEVFPSDWKHLSQCPNISQLRDLDLRGVRLTQFNPKPMQLLLDKVAGTLTTLDLESCYMTDSQISAILPALSHCSQLTTICFYENNISMSVLKDLLGHTASMSHLSLEQYPAPLESYNDTGDLQPETFVQLCAELRETLRAIRQPKMAVFGADPCPHCYHRFLYCTEASPCSCGFNYDCKTIRSFLLDFWNQKPRNRIIYKRIQQSLDPCFL
ncbi:PRAME family member 8 [Fukomys damarensis]|uniref:PRAME family member 12 n=1 Tax=Fukomys damarensis TaxID=885580 RepID=A0A091DKL2_FUKDA|nr:PRAME family member 8 [Fukomys damarensis]KFO31627.1 PRAME family member 12 [Fukomys damarensis]